MKPAYFIAAAFAGALLPSAAFAQDATPAEVTLGVTAGYHDLGISDEVYDLTGVEVDDGSPIFGGFASVDFPVSDSVFIGAEGNLSIGTDAIDSDYGASARLGYRTPNGTKVYVRGGYQWVELDYANMLNVDKSAIPAGGGVDVPIGSKAMFRVNVDTISFDTLRATAGVGFRF